MAIKQDVILNSVLAVMGLCAVATTATVIKDRWSSPTSAPPQPDVRTVAHWRHYAGIGRAMGAPRPTIIITEFADFQCRFCRSTWQQLQELRSRYPEDIQVVFRHFPLKQLHPAATAAAIAAECAGEQGRFEAYYDLLFADQDSLSRANWGSIALKAGVADVKRFTICLRSPETASANIARDVRDGQQLGISATPTMLINDQMIEGSNAALLDSLVGSALRNHKSVSDGRSD